MKRDCMLIISITALVVFTINTQYLFAEKVIVANKVSKTPVIDGIANDPSWSISQQITVRDNLANIDITLKAVYTDEEIFFLVNFPDKDESRTHKSWVWDKGKELYNVGNNIEDVFVFKWNMQSSPVDLSLQGDSPYKADIWFWKACRTDPVGYADDKYHILTPAKAERSTMLTSKSGNTMYLLRKSDKGDSAYKSEIVVEYKGDVVPRYIYSMPSGSRSDIKAKGLWREGRWTIEFKRSLLTDNNDDIQFDVNRNYQFGVSRNEIAGRTPDQDLAQPLYGSGDISEIITLKCVLRPTKNDSTIPKLTDSNKISKGRHKELNSI